MASSAGAVETIASTVERIQPCRGYHGGLRSQLAASRGNAVDSGDSMCRFAIFEDGAESTSSADKSEILAPGAPPGRARPAAPGITIPVENVPAAEFPDWTSPRPGRPLAERMTGGTPGPAFSRQRVKDCLAGVRP